MATTINQTYVLAEGERVNLKAKLELQVQITQFPEQNLSVIQASIWEYCTNISSDTIKNFYIGSHQDYWFYGNQICEVDGTQYEGKTSNIRLGSDSQNVEPGETVSRKKGTLTLRLYHTIDGGTLKIHYSHNLEWVHANGSAYYFTVAMGVTPIKEITIDIPSIDRAIFPIIADNFTDEGEPAFTYTPTTGKSLNIKQITIYEDGTQRTYKNIYDGFRNDVESMEDSISSIQAALSFDGETADIAYRNVSLDSTSYTFELTNAERDLLRQKAQGSPNVPIYYLIKTVRKIPDEEYSTYKYTYDEPAEFISKTQRTLTIAGCEPQLNPTVKDIHARTLELTGNENKFIRYCSTAQFSTGAVASKYATIVSQSVINGSHTVNNLSSGTIENVDSNTFYFAATDSRNLTVRQALVRELVPYVKLTSRISAADLGTDGALTFTVTGNYYNGSFGVKNNSLEFQYGLRVNNGDITWYNISPTPTFSGNTYSMTYRVEGFTYRDQISLIVNVIDEITSVQTNPKVITSIPIFDWSENDFRHRTDVYLDKGKKLMTFDENDSSLDVLAVNENNSNLTIGNTSTDTTIQGNNINLVSSNPISINGSLIGSNKVLWSGASHMNANQSITLTEGISDQTNGIVLVFSLYRNSSAEDVSINSFFVSKKEIELLSGAPHSFFILVNAGFSILGAKYLYISDTAITGHEGNTQTGTNNGITFNNSNYVLRYVIGV